MDENLKQEQNLVDDTQQTVTNVPEEVKVASVLENAKNRKEFKAMNNKTLMLIIVSLVALLIGGYTIYSKTFTKENVIKQMFYTMNEQYLKFSDFSKNYTLDYTDKAVGLNGGLTLNTDGYLFDGYSINYDIQVNDTLDKVYTDLNVSTKEEIILGLIATVENNLTAMQFTNIFDKTITTTDSTLEVTPSSSITLEDTNYLVEVITDALANNVTSDLVSQDEYKTHGVDVTRHTLSITNSYLENVLSEISDDEKAVAILASLMNVSSNEVKTMLSEKVELENELSLSVFTTGILKEYKGFELRVDNEVIIDYIDNVLYLIDNSSTTMYVEFLDVTTLVFEDKESNTSVNLTYKEEYAGKYSGEIKVTSGYDSIDLNYSFELVKENDTVQFNFKINTEIEGLTLELILENEVLVLDSIESLDITDSVDIDSLTEEDYTAIGTNLNDALIGTDFEMIIQLITGFMSV